MTGLLLLSGGRGRRMGASKHDLPHPDGGTWGGHLVRVFRALWPEGPVVVLGEPLPDHPDLLRCEDPREGPAVALRAWAQQDVPLPPVMRWWLVACDQVRWTVPSLRAWHRRVQAVDPAASHWVLATQEGHLQPLGGFLSDGLRPALAQSSATSLTGLATSLPHRLLPADGPEWQDLDTPEARRAFEAERRS